MSRNEAGRHFLDAGSEDAQKYPETNATLNSQPRLHNILSPLSVLAEGFPTPHSTQRSCLKQCRDDGTNWVTCTIALLDCSLDGGAGLTVKLSGW